MTRQIFSAVTGMSSAVTPRGASASSTALITAASAAVQPDSPQPFTPSGLVLQGISFLAQPKNGSYAARGRQ